MKTLLPASSKPHNNPSRRCIFDSFNVDGVRYSQWHGHKDRLVLSRHSPGDLR